GNDVGGQVTIIDRDRHAGGSAYPLYEKGIDSDVDLERSRDLFVRTTPLERQQCGLNGHARCGPLLDEVHARTKPLFEFSDGDEGSQTTASRKQPLANEFR